MQFIFYLISALILTFIFISVIIGLFAGGNSFFNAFKKGVKFLLIASLILAVFYIIYSYLSSLSFKLKNPVEAFEQSYYNLKKEGLDLLTARPYYLIIVCLGLTSFIGGLFKLFVFKDRDYKELFTLSLFLFIIGFYIFAFSYEGLNFKNFAKYSIATLFTLASTFYSIIYISYLTNSHSFLGKILIPKLVFDEINSKKYPKLYAYYQLFGCFLLPSVSIYFMFYR